MSELAEELKVFLGEAFPSVWVAGELQRIRLSPSGHLYFELVEKGDHDHIVGRLEGVLFRRDLERVRRLLRRSGQDLVEGREVRCRGAVDVFAAGGRLQLVVREIDPVFSLGMLERRRRELVAELAAAGLFDRNRALALPALPLRVGLVTSVGSAAYHDFMSSLEASGYGFQVVLAATPVQGQGAEVRVAAALSSLRGAEIACAVLVRGGGARSDLQVFDSRVVAEAIARAPFPVLTGLGHEIDQSIADLVAHTSVKTPTMAAELLVDRLEKAEARIRELERALDRGARLPIARSRLYAAGLEHRLRLATDRVAACARRLEEVRMRTANGARGCIRAARHRTRETGARLGRAAPRALERRRPLGEALTRRIAERVEARLRLEDGRVRALERLAAELRPERTLARGFSITRAHDGTLLRDVRQTAPGERITTELAQGRLTSTIDGHDGRTAPGKDGA
ncbi:MAG TPA: exodeoxyribonuclease VII large subunit [Thermoanaerobaculia bacterium]|nr:exodeoxyribonuclease VII large subunit [Thermoanaerobaculia bacterium]